RMGEGAVVAGVNAVAQAIYEQGIAPTLPIDANAFRARTVADDACGIQGKADLSAAKTQSGEREGALTDVVFDGKVGSCEPTSAIPPTTDIDANQGMVMLW